MRCLSIVLVGMVVVGFLGNVTFGQEATGIPKEIMEELNYLAGSWEVEGKVGDKEQTGIYTCWWGRTEDKKKVCLVGRFSYKTGDKTRNGMNLIGWDAAKKCVEDRGFDANGGNATLLWTMKSPTEWQGSVTMVEDGREVKSKSVLMKKGPSEIVIESENEQGEVARFVFRKVKEESKKKAKE